MCHSTSLLQGLAWVSSHLAELWGRPETRGFSLKLRFVEMCERTGDRELGTLLLTRDIEVARKMSAVTKTLSHE